MYEPIAEYSALPRFEDFYRDKSVFLTGAAGFVGVILLETLLRCCPGIKTIYILLRSKKNVHPEARKEQMFDRKIFEKIRMESPELLKKVCVIAGDVSLPKLGMNEEDLQLLANEVSVVFHCAAVTNFMKPLQFILTNNVLGVSRVIELCRQMKKFEVLVYTSTAYCNSNIVNLPLKEEIHRLPVRSEKFLDALKNEDNKTLQDLIARCKPAWPNSYTFSKCLAENVIMDTASDLPVAIIRPSVVICTWKHPIPGYLEENSGLTALSLGVGKGFVKVIHADPHFKLNLVPADIVTNSHVLGAWIAGTKRSASPLIVNCTATENLIVEFYKHNDSLIQMVRDFPLPQSFELPQNLMIVRNKFLYYILAAYYHYIPAIVLDVLLRISEKKPRLCSLYRFFDKVMSFMDYFLSQEFEFERENMQYLDKLTHHEGRKDLALDLKGADIIQMTSFIPRASPFYDWKIDRKSKLERAKTTKNRHRLISGIQGMFLVTLCLFIYWAISLIFC